MDDVLNPTGSQGSIGANESGVFVVGAPNANGIGIGANENGVFGVDNQGNNGGSFGASFGSLLSGNADGIGSNINPFKPQSLMAQRIGGISGYNSDQSANDLSRYLGNEYNMANWM